MKRKLRTISKFLKIKERVLVTLLFAFVLSCMSIGYAYYQSELSIEANVKLLKGEEKEFFTKGYIIMYDRNNITFKLTDGKNCAYKDKFDKAGVITMNQKCKDYKIVKK